MNEKEREREREREKERHEKSSTNVLAVAKNAHGTCMHREEEESLHYPAGGAVVESGGNDRG